MTSLATMSSLKTTSRVSLSAPSSALARRLQPAGAVWSVETGKCGPEMLPMALPARSSTSASTLRVTSPGVMTRSLETTRTVEPSARIVAEVSEAAGLNM